MIQIYCYHSGNTVLINQWLLNWNTDGVTQIQSMNFNEPFGLNSNVLILINCIMHRFGPLVRLSRMTNWNYKGIILKLLKLSSSSSECEHCSHKAGRSLWMVLFRYRWCYLFHSLDICMSKPIERDTSQLNVTHYNWSGHITIDRDSSVLLIKQSKYRRIQELHRSVKSI